MSPASEWTQKVTHLILENKADIRLAFRRFELTSEEKLGAVNGGIIDTLTNKKLPREKFILYSIITALIYLEKPGFA